MKTLPRVLDLYLRIFLLVLGVTMGVMFLFAGAKAALAASLRHTTVISGDMLKAGDLFDGLSAEKAAYVLGPSPQPGQEMVLNATTLMRVASTLNLPWQPSSAAEQVVIRRAGTIIGEEAIRAKLSAGLEEKGLEGRYLMKVIGKPQMTMPENQPETVEISVLNYDPQRGNFTAELVAPSREKPLTKIIVSGTVEHLVPVPVLKSTMKTGDIIGTHDLGWIDIPSKEIAADFIISADKIVGLTPRRIVEPGKPLRDLEFERPQMISRGSNITLIYQSGPLVLTTRGKSLQNGAKGDIVKVVNTSSNKSIDGFVTAENEVTVSDPVTQ